MASHNDSDRVTAASLLVALGIIYGDIGTSPLYVLKAIIGEQAITHEFVLGGLSCIFWTLTVLTTIKYVFLILRADNNGEGGIFSLYALVRRRDRWLIFPAIIGGSALLADGIITPPISVSSAIEGLRIISPNIPTVPIVIGIIILLFSVQHFGTSAVGKSFGPVMFVWFTTIGVLGCMEILRLPSIFEALNPYWAYHLLRYHEGGFWLLGAIFLCTTGAEALYSDLGHCGIQNIRVSWVFVKTSLLLNYFGQGAWLLLHEGKTLEGQNPFFGIMPHGFLMVGIAISTAATIIASQALISGSFTIVSEAIRLYLFPKAKVIYPTEMKGQIYVPALNYLLLIGCLGIVLYFRESSNMEAAYGLAITLTMLMTTVLYAYYLTLRRAAPMVIAFFLLFYLTIEGSFLVANLDKFEHGGWVTLLVGGILFLIMWIWNRASLLKRRYTEYVFLNDHLDLLHNLGEDKSVDKYATHLVYLTGAPVPEMIESKIVYSLFRKTPKRADVYWFIHVAVSDEPYTSEYEVTTLVPNKVYRIDFNLGFRREPRINMLFRDVIREMAATGEVDLLSRYDSLRKNGIPGDFQFVVLEKSLSYENALPIYEKFIMNGYFFLKRFSLSQEKSFGLDMSSVTSEKVPLLISPARSYGPMRNLRRT